MSLPVDSEKNTQRLRFFRNHSWREHAAALAALAFCNGILFRDYWSGYRIFSGKDFLTAFAPLLNFQTDCLRSGSWPLWNPFMNFGYPYVEHYVNSAFFPTHLLMGLLTGSSLLLIQREILLWIMIGGFGIYLCVRELGLKTTTGILAGISFMGCGQIIALPQWSTLVYNAACFPYLILGYHRAKRLSTAFSPTSILFLSLSIFGGYIVTTVLGIYLFSAYVVLDAVLSRRAAFALRYLSLTIALAMALTSPKLLPLYASIASSPRLASVPPPAGAPLDAFNIISPYNLMSILLPVKYYFSLFLGSLGLLALLHGMLRRSIRFTPLLAMALFSGYLLLYDSTGRPSLLRDLAEYLPFMRLVRNDWLSWFFPSIFGILFLSRHVEDFLAGKPDRPRAVAVGLYACALTLAYLAAYNHALYAGAYAVHLALGAGFLIVLFLAGRPALTGGVILLALLELTLVFNRVNVDIPPQHQADLVLFTIVDQASIPRSYREDNRIESAFEALAVDDRMRPTIDQARAQPVLFSGLHGMPAINYAPEQYGMFIDDMNLKRFSGWWYNTQERFDFIGLKDSPLLAGLDGAPLYQYSVPGSPVPASAAVSFDRLSCSGFGFRVLSEQPGEFLLRQMFDSRWRVAVDGIDRKPAIAEGYFMGIALDAGEHHLEFSFRDRLFIVAVFVSCLTLGATVSAIWLLRSRTERGRHSEDETDGGE